MNVFTAEELVYLCILVFISAIWEAPAGPALVVTFGVWLDNGNVDYIRKTFQVTDKVCSVGKGTEQACIRNQAGQSQTLVSTCQCTDDNGPLRVDNDHLVRFDHAIHRQSLHYGRRMSWR